MPGYTGYPDAGFEAYPNGLTVPVVSGFSEGFGNCSFGENVTVAVERYSDHTPIMSSFNYVCKGDPIEHFQVNYPPNLSDPYEIEVKIDGPGGAHYAAYLASTEPPDLTVSEYMYNGFSSIKTTTEGLIVDNILTFVGIFAVVFAVKMIPRWIKKFTKQ